MMPTRVVVLHRWQVFAAFFAITLAYVLGLVAIQHETRARTTSLHQVAVRSCADRHKLAASQLAANQALIDFLDRTLPPRPATRPTPQQLRALGNLYKLRVDLRRSGVLAKNADCQGVPALPSG